MVITKLDRIARSVTQGIELIQKLLDRGIVVHVLNMSIPAPIEPPVRSLRATLPAVQSHLSGNGNHPR